MALRDEVQLRNLLKKHIRDVDGFFDAKVSAGQLMSVFKEDAVRTRGSVSHVGIEAIKNAFVMQRDEIVSMRHEVKHIIIRVKDNAASATLEWTVRVRSKNGRQRKDTGFDAFVFDKEPGGVWKIASIIIMPHGGILS